MLVTHIEIVNSVCVCVCVHLADSHERQTSAKIKINKIKFYIKNYFGAVDTNGN